MIYRWTLWSDADGGDLQLCLAILNASWEPQLEFCVPLGPFCGRAEGRADLLAQVDEWLLAHGIAEELPL